MSLNFTKFEKNEWYYATKPTFETFINEEGELKKKRENYFINRQGLTKENFKEYNYEQNPNHPLCLIFTGEISDLTVIDIDSKKLYWELVELVKEKDNGDLTEVYTVETKRGYHLYFGHDEDIKKTQNDVFTKYQELGQVDIRNDSDIITAEGSFYISELDKKKYTYKYVYGDLNYEIPKSIKSLIKPKCFYSNDKEEEEEEPTKKYDKLTDEEISNIIDLIDDDKAGDYQTWNECGMALFNDLGKDARKFFHEFSKKCKSKYNKKEVDKHFDNYKKANTNNKITIGTLRKWAKEANPEEYKKLFSKAPPSTEFWDMMKLFNNSDMAKYYVSITNQRFIYCKNTWYGYDDYNVITELNEKTPTQLIANISKVLQTKLNEEIKKIEPNDKIYDETFKLYKACYKSVGTSSFVKGTIDYIQSYYNDDKLREKLDNNNNLLAFTDKLVDFKNKCVRNIEMNDFISITTGYKYPTKSNQTIRKEIKDLIYSVFENEQMTKYWLESVSMAIYSNKFESFYIHTGTGRNGKGVLFGLVEKAIGKYTSTADASFLTTRIESGKPNPILTKANGKRMMMITEPETEDNNKKEIKLNVDLIKKLSGLDKIEARDLFQKSKDVIEYTPQFTCFLQCNQTPELGKLDIGIKQRLKIIEYPFTFVELPTQEHERKKDMDLKEKLSNQEYINEMILLMIDTVNKFTKFDTPNKILEANNDYFNQCDPIKEWFFANYEITRNKKDKIRTSQILNEFVKFSGKPMVSAKFNNYLASYDISKIKDGNGCMCFNGIKQKTTEEEEKKSDLDF